MSSLNFLYISCGIGFLVLVGFACYLLKEMAETMKKMQRVLENLESTTDDIVSFKDGIKTSGLRVVSKLFKGGSKYV